MADRVGMSRMALLRYEQGFHKTLSLKLISFFKENDENFTTVDALVVKYINFQRSCRVHSYGLLDPNYDFSVYLSGDNVRSEMHPLLRWMQVSQKKPNLTQLSKGFCLHHPTMHRFITRPSLVADVPTCFDDALMEAGYDITCRLSFYEAYVKWRAAKFDITYRSKYIP
jgi:hypothetical protein